MRGIHLSISYLLILSYLISQVVMEAAFWSIAEILTGNIPSKENFIPCVLQYIWTVFF